MFCVLCCVDVVCLIELEYCVVFFFGNEKGDEELLKCLCVCGVCGCMLMCVVL